jgi:hypothetical protein
VAAVGREAFGVLDVHAERDRDRRRFRGAVGRELHPEYRVRTSVIHEQQPLAVGQHHEARSLEGPAGDPEGRPEGSREPECGHE